MDQIHAKIGELRLVKVLDSVHLLQANNAGLGLSYFFDDPGTAVVEVQDRRSCVRELAQ